MKSEKIKFIQIPYNLARLLVSTPDEYENPEHYQFTTELARKMLKVLMKSSK